MASHFSAARRTHWVDTRFVASLYSRAEYLSCPVCLPRFQRYRVTDKTSRLRIARCHQPIKVNVTIEQKCEKHSAYIRQIAAGFNVLWSAQQRIDAVGGYPNDTLYEWTTCCQLNVIIPPRNSFIRSRLSVNWNRLMWRKTVCVCLLKSSYCSRYVMVLPVILEQLVLT